MYNLRADPDLGIAKVAVRRIPCCCQSCRDQLLSPWIANTPAEEQPRYKTNQSCHWWPIFEGLNDWHIVTLVVGKDDDAQADLLEEAQNLFLDSRAEEAFKQIVVGQRGAFATDDPDADGYYVVEWTGLPERLKNDVVIDDFDPPMILKRGEKVVRGKYWNKVPGAKQWYTPSDPEEYVTVRLQQVLCAHLVLVEESPTCTLPNSLRNKSSVRRKGAMRVSDRDHARIDQEVERRDILDFVEEEEGDQEEDDEISSGSDENDVEEDEFDSEDDDSA